MWSWSAPAAPERPRWSRPSSPRPVRSAVPGTVESGTTVCDFEDAERRVGRSVSLAIASTVVDPAQHPRLSAGGGPGPAQSGRHPRPRRFRRRVAGRPAGGRRGPLRHLRIGHRGQRWRHRRRHPGAVAGMRGRRHAAGDCRSPTSTSHAAISMPPWRIANSSSVTGCTRCIVPAAAGGAGGPTGADRPALAERLRHRQRVPVARPARRDERPRSPAAGRPHRSGDHRVGGRRTAGPLPGRRAGRIRHASSRTWKPQWPAARSIRCCPACRSPGSAFPNCSK